MSARDEFIKEYFERGYSYRTILVCLYLKNGISLSLRQLKRVLRRLGLRNRSDLSVGHLMRVETLIRVGYWLLVQSMKRSADSLHVVPTAQLLSCLCPVLQREIEGSSITLGYRGLWRRIKQKYKIPVSRYIITPSLPTVSDLTVYIYTLALRNFNSVCCPYLVLSYNLHNGYITWSFYSPLVPYFIYVIIFMQKNRYGASSYYIS